MREIHSEEFLPQLPLDHGSYITVSRVDGRAASPVTLPIALAVGRSLDHEDSSVLQYSLQHFKHSHGWVIFQLLMRVILPSSCKHESKGIRLAAAESSPGWKKSVEPIMVKSCIFFFQPLSETKRFPWIFKSSWGMTHWIVFTITYLYIIFWWGDRELSREHQGGSQKMMGG